MVYITEDICNGTDAYGRPMTSHTWENTGETFYIRAPRRGYYYITSGDYCGQQPKNQCVLKEEGEIVYYGKIDRKSCQVPDANREVDIDGQEGPDYMMECMMAGGEIDMSQKPKMTGGIFRGPVMPWEFYPAGSPEYTRLLNERREAVRNCDPDVIELMAEEDVRRENVSGEGFTMEVCLKRKERRLAIELAEAQHLERVTRLETAAYENSDQKWVFTESVDVETSAPVTAFEYNQSTLIKPTLRTCILHCQGNEACSGVSITKDSTSCKGQMGTVKSYTPDRYVPDPVTGLMMKRNPLVSEWAPGDWENRDYFSKDDNRGENIPYIRDEASGRTSHTSRPLQYELDLQANELELEIAEYTTELEVKRPKFSLSTNGFCGSSESGSGTEQGTRCPLTQCCGLAGYYAGRSGLSRKCGGQHGESDTSYCGSGRSIAARNIADYDGLGAAADERDRQEYFDEVYHCLEGDRCKQSWDGGSDPKCKDLKYPRESLNPPDEWNGKFGANVCPEPIENNDRSRVVVTGNTLNEWKRVKGGTDGPFDGVGWGLIKSRGGWSETDHTLGKFTGLDPAGGTSAAYSACKNLLSGWTTVGFATWRKKQDTNFSSNDEWMCREYSNNDNVHPYDNECVNTPWTNGQCRTTLPDQNPGDVDYKDHNLAQGALYWRRTGGPDESISELDKLYDSIIVDGEVVPDDVQPPSGYTDDRMQDGKQRSSTGKCGYDGSPRFSRCGGDTACCSTSQWCGGTRGVTSAHCSGENGVGGYNNGDYDALPLSAPSPPTPTPTPTPTPKPSYHYSTDKIGCWMNNTAYSAGDKFCLWTRYAGPTSCAKHKCPSSYIKETTDGKGESLPL